MKAHRTYPKVDKAFKKLDSVYSILETPVVLAYCKRTAARNTFRIGS
jgi:hypothetical protein